MQRLVMALALLLSLGACAAPVQGVLQSSKNSEVKAEEPAVKHVVACLGDSITYGYGVSAARERDAWPFVLNGLLGDGYEVLDLGANGATLLDEGDFPFRQTGLLTRAIAAKPETALVMLGTNDSRASNWNADTYEAELGMLVDELGDVCPDVVLVTPPKCFVSELGDYFDDHVIGGPIRESVLRVARTRELRSVDLYGFTEGHPEWFDDGVHPNAEGNRAIAEFVHQQLWG